MAYVYKRDGSPFYQCCIETSAGPRRLSTKERNKQKAEQAAERLETEARLAEKQSIHLLEGAARMFREGHLKPKTLEGYTSSLSNIHGVLGDFKLGSLTPYGVNTYIDTRRRETKVIRVPNPKYGQVIAGVKVKEKWVTKRVPYPNESRIINDLRFLSSLMKRAMSWEGSGVTENPVVHPLVKGKALRKAENRTSALTVREVKADYQRLFIMLSVDTGMRLRETLHLTWDEVDIEDGVIRLRGKTRTKTGAYRFIPLTERCLDTLRNTQKSTNGKYVFPGRLDAQGKLHPMTTIKTFWQRVTTDAGLKGVRIHDLRHTFASLARESGMDPLFAQEILGHSTSSMTDRYSHPGKDTLRDAIVRFECTKDYTKPSDQSPRA
jgi:integrase